ncbi:unnamed protein product [Cylicocyclus nassatus]|uniref:W02B3.4-like N-terminal domain-containing protein n=1 Tax=Cylicocyclus nassatus TaxID=53992 RepID=A0AA36M939_CYLNA|nr:unnamed protein product [Cylicocyclus nassatus]
MKPRRSGAVFAGIILASIIFVYLKLHQHEWMRSSSLTFSQIFSTPLDLRQEKISVLTLLDSIIPSFPAILIDTRLLIALYKGYSTSKRKIKLAVDIKYINHIDGSELQTYDIFYYDNQTNNNYILIYDNHARIIPSASDVITHASFVSFNVFPFLAGGSLLGWYRECNIIPHTMDVDFAAPINEYRPALLEHLQSNQSELFLKRKLGTLNNSLEFTLLPAGRNAPLMDVFWLYTIANESWVAGLASDAKKYKYSYPRISKICAGDLLGHIFWVPCNTQTVIEKEYGPEWKRDHSTNNFSWYSSHFNVVENGRWTMDEMEEVYHSY